MIISKDESLKDSMVHIGYHIAKCLEGAIDGRRSLVEVMMYLKQRHIHNYRSIQFALLFLPISSLAVSLLHGGRSSSWSRSDAR